MSIRLLDLLRSGFRREKKPDRLILSDCYIFNDELIIIHGAYTQVDQYPCIMGGRFSQTIQPSELGRNILNGWQQLKAQSQPMSQDEKLGQMNEFSERFGFKDVKEFWKKTESITIAGAYPKPFREFISIDLTYKRGTGWNTIHENTGLTFVCRRESRLIGKFIKEAVKLAVDKDALEEELAKRKYRESKENRARRKWTKLKVEDGKPEKAKQMLQMFSVGQRVCHVVSNRQGSVIHIDPKYHGGHGLVVVELDDGEIISSMLILPWFEALEQTGLTESVIIEDDELDVTQDGFQVGSIVVHIVSRRRGVIKHIDPSAEHGMGRIEVELEDGEVILTSCIAPGLKIIS